MFTQDELKKLISYYETKLIGKPLDKSIPNALISKFVVFGEPNAERKNLLVQSTYGPFKPFKDIADIATDFGLPSPQDVLSDQSQD